MKLCVVHSNGYDFRRELYSPLRNSELNKQHKIFLPHEAEELIKTKDLIKDADVVVAEVSFPTTGLGIELGWADAFNKPIFCLFKSGSKFSASLHTISEIFIEYSNGENLIEALTQALEKHHKLEENGQ